MTDDTKKPGPDADVAEEFVDPALVGEEQAETAEPDPVELLKAENADLRDKFLRLAAEMDNLRRRTERDVKDAKAYSLAGFARDMLAVSDNLRRALEAIPDELKTNGEAGLNGLIEGVEMTERSMLSTLERHGVKKIDAEGQKFDPNFHQAMFEIPNTKVPNNTVVELDLHFPPSYRLHDTSFILGYSGESSVSVLERLLVHQQTTSLTVIPVTGMGKGT